MCRPSFEQGFKEGREDVFRELGFGPKPSGMLSVVELRELFEGRLDRLENETKELYKRMHQRDKAWERVRRAFFGEGA